MITRIKWKKHTAAFSSVQKVIDRDIVLGEKIVQLSYLTKIYTESLSKTDFTNNNYRPENLKAKIENCSKYRNSISFAKLREFESSLVYNKKIPAEKLICESFQRGTNKQLKNVGQIIKTQIKSYFEETQRTPIRPITSESLGHVDLPPNLSELLSYIIFNEGYEHDITSKKSRPISSIGQDICRAATRGKWKLPKHVGLGMTVRHLFRSKELMTVLTDSGILKITVLLSNWKQQ